MIKNLLIGMFGMGLCALGCWIAGKYGKGNVRNGYIQSNWSKMGYLQFEISLILESIGVAISYIGIKDYIKSVRMVHRKRHPYDGFMGILFEIGCVAFLVSFLFIQTGYIFMALVYKHLYETSLMGADIISTVEGSFNYIAIPLFAFLAISVGASSLAYMYFVLTGGFKVSKICILFNPLVFLGIGEVLKLTKQFYLVDAASGFIPLGFLLMMSVGSVHISSMPVKKASAARNRNSERTTNRDRNISRDRDLSRDYNRDFNRDRIRNSRNFRNGFDEEDSLY